MHRGAEGAGAFAVDEAHGPKAAGAGLGEVRGDQGTQIRRPKGVQIELVRDR